LRYVENRLDKLENQSERPLTSRGFDKKLEYLEEKLIESTELAIKAERQSIEFQSNILNRFDELERKFNNTTNSKNEINLKNENIVDIEKKLSDIEKKFNNKFNKIKS